MLFRGFSADVRLGGRRLRQAPGFTLLAVATLSVGLGALSTVFSVAYAMWLKPLPWFEPDRVVRVFAVHETMGSTGSLSARDFEDNGRMLGGLHLPTLVVQEGGYRTRTLGSNARHFFQGLLEAIHE